MAEITRFVFEVLKNRPTKSYFSWLSVLLYLCQYILQTYWFFSYCDLKAEAEERWENRSLKQLCL